MLANLAQIGVDDLAARISKIYLGDKMTLPVAIQVAAEVMQTYVGRYEIAPGFIAEVSLENNVLWIKMPDAMRWKLLPESETAYFLDGREEEKVTFNKDENGRVVSLTGGRMTARKL